jgi:hypothetical protein
MLSRSSHHQINFTAINRAALACLPVILNRLLFRGQREGREFVALNPNRADHHLGSFRINLDTGRLGGLRDWRQGRRSSFACRLSRGRLARRGGAAASPDAGS